MRTPLTGVFEKMFGIGAMKSEEELDGLIKTLSKSKFTLKFDKFAQSAEKQDDGDQSSAAKRHVKLFKVGKVETEEDVKREAEKLYTQLRASKKKTGWQCFVKFSLKLGLVLLGFIVILQVAEGTDITEDQVITLFWSWAFFAVFLYRRAIIKSLRLLKSTSSTIWKNSSTLNSIEKFYLLMWLFAVIAAGSLFGFWGAILVGAVLLIIKL